VASAENTDVVVVGGGPVGLATAIAARQHGLSVTLFERAQPPIDKACGEGLMPAGVAALARLGVGLPSPCAALRGIRYRSDGVVAEADFPGGERGAGIRRTVLHAALLERAGQTGVELRFGVLVEGIEDGAVRIAGGLVRGRFVVGADGLRSRVRRWSGLGRRDEPSGLAGQRFGVSRHFRTATADGSPVEVIFGDRAEAYLTPLAPDEIGVAILWSGDAAMRGGFDALLAARFDEALRARLAPLERLGQDRGSGPFRQRVVRRTRGALALVGDAGGYVDALTGEGLSLGFEQALALGEALGHGDLARYEREARRLALLPERLTRLALFAARHPALRRRYVAALARDPALFTALLGALGARRPLAASTVATLFGRLAFARPARAALLAARTAR